MDISFTEGWMSDPEQEEELIFRRRDSTTSQHDGRSLVPVKQQNNEVEMGQQGDRQLIVELKRRVAELDFQSVESKRNEEILTAELRRLRLQYDSAIFQQSQRIISNFDKERKQQQEEKLDKEPEQNQHQQRGGKNEFFEERNEIESEIRKLKFLLDQSRCELEEARQTSKEAALSLNKKLAQERATVDQLRCENERLASNLELMKRKVQFQDAEMGNLRQQVERLNLELNEVTNSKNEQLETSKAQYDSFKSEAQGTIEKLTKELAAIKTQLHDTTHKLQKDSERQEKDLYDQFVAYRDLWKNCQASIEKHSQLIVAIQAILCKGDSNNLNQQQQSFDGQSFEQQREILLVAASKVVNQLAKERKLREASEKNYGICQKRLDRTLGKVENLNEQIAHLEQCQKDIVGMTVDQYQDWLLTSSADNNNKDKKSKKRQKGLSATTSTPNLKKNNNTASKPATGYHWNSKRNIENTFTLPGIGK